MYDEVIIYLDDGKPDTNVGILDARLIPPFLIVFLECAFHAFVWQKREFFDCKGKVD